MKIKPCGGSRSWISSHKLHHRFCFAATRSLSTERTNPNKHPETTGLSSPAVRSQAASTTTDIATTVTAFPTEATRISLVFSGRTDEPTLYSYTPIIQPLETVRQERRYPANCLHILQGHIVRPILHQLQQPIEALQNLPKRQVRY